MTQSLGALTLVVRDDDAALGKVAIFKDLHGKDLHGNRWDLPELRA